ncbi:hypothetical protein SAMN02745248_02772 [Hathewaya proteolytica DSM 3090]|uniref:Calcineurin-like phosphoesterase domain-containing protein n=2 Tax=Hathewaya proteolytica TaxID=29365 RepID=A0A1M6TAC8_9CLOT|nr:hypothetical protein SAMN02745248_02772 [Hathewaya proteolytica DSM 3090]
MRRCVLLICPKLSAIYYMKKNKNKFLRCVVLFTTLVITWAVNTFTIKKTYISIFDKKINDKITIVQITDLHGSNFGLDNDILISKIRRENPDIIAVTGDMYTHYQDENLTKKGRETAIRLMEELSKEFKVYFVNGEHDNCNTYKETLKHKGVHVLDYKSEPIIIGKTKINLYGVNNVYYSSTYDLSNEFSIDKSSYNILMAHICNADAFTKFGMDLSLCGDTHGGQVRVPFVGAIYDGNSLLPEISKNKDKNFVKGLYQYRDKKIFISSGLGNYPITVRLFNRPEIAVIKLQGEN